MRRIGDDASIPAVIGKAIFSAKAALLPRSRRSWATKVTTVRRTTGPNPIRKGGAPPKAPRVPEPARAPTVTHGTNNRTVMPKRGYSGPARVVAKRAKTPYRPTFGPITKSDHLALVALKHQLKREMKNKDGTVPASTQALNTGYWQSITEDIAQGDSSYKRNGDGIDLQSLALRLNFEAKSGAAVCQFARIFLILDKQANGKVGGTDWIVKDILEDGTHADVDVPPKITERFRNLSESGRFQVLYDRRIQVNPDAGSSKTCAQIRKFIKFKNVHIKYTKGESTGANSTIQDNNLWLLVVGDGLTGTVPLFEGGYRLRFQG